jgi:hypothetical protein
MMRPYCADGPNGRGMMRPYRAGGLVRTGIARPYRADSPSGLEACGRIVLAGCGRVPPRWDRERRGVIR